MWHLRTDVGNELASTECIEIFGECLPLPRDPVGQRGTGDVFDALHQSNQPLPAVRMRWRETDAAVSHHDGGDTVPAGRGEVGVPCGLSVVVRVHVDPAGCDDLPVGVDLSTAVSSHRAGRPDGDDRVAVDRYFTKVWLSVGPVDDRAVANHDVMHDHIMAHVGELTKCRRTISGLLSGPVD